MLRGILLAFGIVLYAALPTAANPDVKAKTFPDDAPLLYCNGDLSKPCLWLGDRVRNERGDASRIRIEMRGKEAVVTFLDWNNLEGTIDSKLRIIRSANKDTWVASDSLFVPGRVFYHDGDQAQACHFELRNQEPYAVNERGEASRTEWVTHTKYVALDWLEDGKPITVEFKRTGEVRKDGWHGTNGSFWASRPSMGTLYMSGDHRRPCSVGRDGDKWWCKNERHEVVPLEWETQTVVRTLTPSGVIKGYWHDGGLIFENGTEWRARPGDIAKDQRIEFNFEKIRSLFPKHDDKFTFGSCELTLKDGDNAKAIEATGGGLLVRAYWDVPEMNLHGWITLRVRCAIVRSNVRIEGIDVVAISCTDFLADRFGNLKGRTQEQVDKSVRQIEAEVNKYVAGAINSSPIGKTLGPSLSMFLMARKVVVVLHDAN